MSGTIEIDDLLIRRDKNIVLEIDHISIKTNQVTALMGSNGAGKTTLLLALAGILKPEKGKITYQDGTTALFTDLKYRRRVGLVMQESTLLDRSVYKNVCLGLRFRKLPKQEITNRANEWLDRLGISHLQDRNAKKISGGEAQRVALARAFVLQPDILLLDEPFKSLDEQSHSSLIADLKAILPGINTTTIFATHSNKDVRDLADQKIILNCGKLITS